jgi:hypothetical protein
MAPRARFELATLRLTADEIKNLSALSGVAYKKTGAILHPLVAPNPAPKLKPRVVETYGLEKLNRRFAISSKNQLNPFASRKIATISVFWICWVLS